MASEEAARIDRWLVYHEWINGAETADIIARLEVSRGKDAPHPSTVYRYVQELEKETFAFDRRQQSRPGMDPEKIWAVEEAVEEHKSASLRMLSILSGINRRAVTIAINDYLHLKRIHSKWILHELSNQNKSDRVRLAGEMLKILKQRAKFNYAGIITGDETWVSYQNEYDWTWGEKGSSRQEKARLTIASKKVMISVFFSVDGMHVIDALPNGQTINSAYFVSKILSPLDKYFKTIAKPHFPIYVHYDNAAPQKAKHTVDFLSRSCLTGMPHPPYSPDVAPCDFSLFGSLKQKLKGQTFHSHHDALKAVQQVLCSLTAQDRINIFRSWEERLERLSDSDGGYL
ncbi:putative Histone-lysine N-methyltransferase SETMAR [Blattamonas nauphoetae]|uniref:Histone-lysine N-methyltransferase SETMAR n=1 Tax=Blattamonas nauphoetae TaxID=2049346 RepID=A0ABQ9YBS1_9EUKA|nr:putative Histone-lysine N-methyltransferase SETMAR [Blattamonas nauphoetae]